MERVAARCLAAVLLCLLVATGCAALAEVVNLGARVQEAGYSNVQVHHDTSNGFDTVAITASGGEEGGDGEDIARLVWDTYPAEVDELVLRLNDREHTATRAELEKSFGPRKIRVDPDNTLDPKTELWWAAGIGLFLLSCGVITLLAVLLRKRRRRLPPQPPNPR